MERLRDIGRTFVPMKAREVIARHRQVSVYMPEKREVQEYRWKQEAKMNHPPLYIVHRELTIPQKTRGISLLPVDNRIRFGSYGGGWLAEATLLEKAEQPRSAEDIIGQAFLGDVDKIGTQMVDIAREWVCNSTNKEVLETAIQIPENAEPGMRGYIDFEISEHARKRRLFTRQ